MNEIKMTKNEAITTIHNVPRDSNVTDDPTPENIIGKIRILKLSLESILIDSTGRNGFFLGFSVATYPTTPIRNVLPTAVATEMMIDTVVFVILMIIYEHQHQQP